MLAAWNRLRIWWSSMWTQVCRFWSSEGPAGDCFWLLDFLLLLAVLQFFDSSQTKSETAFQIVLDVIKVTVVCLVGVRVLLIVSLEKPITSLRKSITSDRVNSGDRAFDELEYRRFNKSGRAMLLIIYGLIIIDTILLSIPNPMKDSVLELPPQLCRVGKQMSGVFYFAFVGFIALSMIPRMFCSLACSGILLMGLRLKLKMLTHRYKTIIEYPFLDADRYYSRVDREVQNVVDQQLECWSQLQVLKDCVGKQFFMVHYFAVFAIGALLFVCQDMGLNILSVAIVTTTMGFLLEYYLWCALVDSLQDEAQTIGYLIFELCAKIPYIHKYRHQYKRLQTSLMITWINTGNGLKMNCMGLFEISKVSFVYLLNVAYKVLMFLINMN
ncbi:uncharacterized protein LOC134215008 [Armigeres subalbatus]|uniref:uncharacterized protein LOC134215008 n=1 Tax=Armigeres subalbatus TaxID=124917 RepID=UPI002ED06EB3